MDIYRELNVELPKDIESVKESVHRFAKDVLRPAAAVLDRMTDPRDVIALDSPLRRVLKQAYQLAYHDAGLPTQTPYGEVYHDPPVRSRVGVPPVRESIYIDTGEWLYHVSQLVTTRGMANLREGDKVEVAVKGKSLILRAGGKRYTTHIEQKSRAGQPVNSPASPR